MALLAVQKSTLAGTTLTYSAAAAGGDTINLVDRSMLIVKNGGSAITVTVVVPGNTQYGLAQPDVTVSVAGGADKMIGPFDAGLADAGVISITYSAVTSVTVAHVAL